MANGESNVIALNACHRIGGQVVLAMPYVKRTKFVDLIADMDLPEMKLYFKNLLVVSR